MDEIHLAATLDLSFDHLFDELVIVRGHIGLDRLAVFWWRLHNAHVADAGDRHMQCARNRSRRQRENVDLRPEPLQALLLNDAKSLLFVDDDESEALEPNIALQQTVSPDHNID